MKSHGTIAGFLALVVALGCSLPIRGAEPDGPPNGGKDDLREDIRQLREEVAKLRALQMERDKLAALEFQALSARLSRIEDSLRRLETPKATGTYSSSFPSRGNIRIDNRLGVRAQITIDNVSYTIPALTVQTLRDRPAGSFVYEVTADGYGITTPKRATLVANDTWTLTIY